jgi:hypothetical protein
VSRIHIFVCTCFTKKQAAPGESRKNNCKLNNFSQSSGRKNQEKEDVFVKQHFSDIADTNFPRAFGARLVSNSCWKIPEMSGFIPHVVPFDCILSVAVIHFLIITCFTKKPTAPGFLP